MSLTIGASRSGRELGYAESVAVYGGSGLATAEATVTGLVVTTLPCDGINPVEIACNLFFTKLVNAGNVSVSIKEGATYLLTRADTLAINANSSLHLVRRLIPTAGVHTYTVRLSLTTVGGQITSDASLLGPSFISVTSR